MQTLKGTSTMNNFDFSTTEIFLLIAIFFCFAFLGFSFALLGYTLLSFIFTGLGIALFVLIELGRG